MREFVGMCSYCCTDAVLDLVLDERGRPVSASAPQTCRHLVLFLAWNAGCRRVCTDLMELDEAWQYDYLFTPDRGLRFAPDSWEDHPDGWLCSYALALGFQDTPFDQPDVPFRADHTAIHNRPQDAWGRDVPVPGGKSPALVGGSVAVFSAQPAEFLRQLEPLAAKFRAWEVEMERNDAQAPPWNAPRRRRALRGQLGAGLSRLTPAMR